MFTAIEAQEVVHNLFGISGKTIRLPGEYDFNFHIRTDEGNEFLLKISHPSEEKALVDMQNEVLQWLQSASKPFHFPKPQPTLTGEWVGHLVSRDGCATLARLFTFVPGKLFAETHYHSPALLESLGQQLGYLSQALAHFQHRAAKRCLKWDLKQAHWIRDQLHSVENEEDKQCIEFFLVKFETEVAKVLPTLRQSVIHGDINDYNTLVSSPSFGNDRVSGFIDFGDLVETATICELAIAVTYAMLNKPDPLEAAAHVIRGYHAVFPLLENEIDILFDLICIRLCMSVVNSAIRKKENPSDSYLTISEKPAWELLRKLREIHSRFARYTFRDACQLEPCPHTITLIEWLKAESESIGSLLQFDIRTVAKGFFDLSPGSLQVDQFDLRLEQMRREGVVLAIGKYNEARLVYSNPQYQVEGNQGLETRTIHIGLDLFMEAGIPLYAPLEGTVHSFADNNLQQDYGPTLILEHNISEKNIIFYTLYGHLNRKSLEHLTVGKVVPKGSLIGWIGNTEVNGGWTPHLHFQIISDLLDHKGNFPGVAEVSKRSIWLSLCPDPNLITRIPREAFPPKKWQKSDIEKARQKQISKSIGLSYKSPLQIERGIGQYLFDENGRKYLDCVNNVCQVGHCHPKVVAAGQEQMALLNTNTRYLHEHLPHYAERLVATLPPPLEVCFFVCSGSEANELALRLAYAHTGRTNLLVMDHAYHGNTSTLVNISPYKFTGPGGKGKPDFVEVLPLPDLLRGKEELEWEPLKSNLAAFICESMLSCGGQIILPDHYLERVYAAVRNVGGLCIADEVQVGLGRVGTHFWGFETQNVVPDIVTMGKPLGNGHPIGAVVTTREIAESFCNGMEYFNTFGGNTVSCAIGLAVLDVLQEENLQTHALHSGNHLKQKLNALKEKHSVIGDVRGLGLFLGVELVTDRISLTPAKDLAAFVINRMKERGILLSTDGPFQNVIKIKPPLVFTKEDGDFLATNLDYVLSSL